MPRKTTHVQDIPQEHWFAVELPNRIQAASSIDELLHLKSERRVVEEGKPSELMFTEKTNKHYISNNKNNKNSQNFKDLFKLYDEKLDQLVANKNWGWFMRWYKRLTNPELAASIKRVSDSHKERPLFKEPQSEWDLSPIKRPVSSSPNPSASKTATTKPSNTQVPSDDHWVSDIDIIALAPRSKLSAFARVINILRGDTTTSVRISKEPEIDPRIGIPLPPPLRKKGASTSSKKELSNGPGRKG
jgi:hypothetical protein